jgi:hypothetical protein
MIDPNGDDWFRNSDGDVRWDDSREKSISYKNQDWSNIGATININTNSYIHEYNDLPVPNASGSKLITYVTITGNYDENGNFKDFTYTYNRTIGATFNVKLLKGTETVPGKSNTPEVLAPKVIDLYKSTIDIETHTTTPPAETVGLNIIGSNVDVTQVLNIGLDNTGLLSIQISHGTYPAVQMTITSSTPTYDKNGGNYYNYMAQSFVKSHGYRTPFILPHTALSSSNYQEISDIMNWRYLYGMSNPQYSWVEKLPVNKANFKEFNAGAKDPNNWSDLKWNYNAK